MVSTVRLCGPWEKQAAQHRRSLQVGQEREAVSRERRTEEILCGEMEPGRDASEGQQKRQEGTLAGEETVVGSRLSGGHQPWE